MKWLSLTSALLVLTAVANPQTVPAPTAAVPRLMRFSGTLTGSGARTILGATFALYKDQTGGTPLWLETQNISLDAQGRYTVQLGAATKDGLPIDLFASAEARWLGVKMEGRDELPRVLLMSVPYALKAADAETLGGLPPSAFVLAPVISPSAPSSDSSDESSRTAEPFASIAGGGTAGFIALWTGTATLGNSGLFQSGSGKSVKVGINSSAPATTLDVGGAATIRGLLNFPATGVATASTGFNSQPLALSASAFNSSTASPITQNFRWQAEPSSNNSTTPSGTLNLLFGQGSATPAETGLKIGSDGKITFAAGQTFPSGGGGGVTSVGLSAPASDFSVAGSPITGSGTLALNWLVAPTSTNTVNAIVKRDANGSFSGTSIMGTTSLTFGASGVSGTATASGASSTIGVSGTSVGDTGLGVYGYAGGSSGIGVYGFSFGASGDGVYGYAPEPNGIGIYGQGGTTGAGVSAHGGSYGVYAAGGSYGVNSSGNYAGVAGYGLPASGTYYAYSPWGVLGNTAAQNGIALAAIAEDGYGLAASNNSAANPTATLANDSSSATAPVLYTSARAPFNSCMIDNSANLYCGGSKSAVVPVDGDSRRVALYAVEAPENWFEDFGSGRLGNGHASVQLDTVFVQTVNMNANYHVFLTPKGECKGLYVTRETSTGFEVRESGGGRSTVEFDYRIVARRKGYEKIRLADMTERFAAIQARLPKIMRGTAPLSAPLKSSLSTPTKP